MGLGTKGAGAGGEWEEEWEGKGGERRERGRKREGGGEGGKVREEAAQLLPLMHGSGVRRPHGFSFPSTTSLVVDLPWQK